MYAYVCVKCIYVCMSVGRYVCMYICIYALVEIFNIIQ